MGSSTTIFDGEERNFDFEAHGIFEILTNKNKKLKLHFGQNDS